MLVSQFYENQCDVAALSLQAHAYYETWSIDFKYHTPHTSLNFKSCIGNNTANI